MKILCFISLLLFQKVRGFLSPVSLNTVTFRSRRESPRTPIYFLPNRKHGAFTLLSTSAKVERSRSSQPSAFIHRLLRKLLFPLRFLLRACFRLAARFASAFLVAVISDPALNRTIADTVKEGMNRFLTQKTVKQKLGTFQQTLSESKPSLAKEAGEDFLKVILSFMEGLLAPDLNPYRSSDEEGESEPQALNLLEKREESGS